LIRHDQLRSRIKRDPISLDRPTINDQRLIVIRDQGLIATVALA
jgi:hypothetical protein